VSPFCPSFLPQPRVYFRNHLLLPSFAARDARSPEPNPRPFKRLQPLCPLFPAAVLCFQWLAASFPKTPGWGYLCATSVRSAPLYPEPQRVRYRLPLLSRPFVFILLQTPSSTTPSVSHPCKTLGVSPTAVPSFQTSSSFARPSVSVYVLFIRGAIVSFGDAGPTYRTGLPPVAREGSHEVL
jgi:hypothetical protein